MRNRGRRLSSARSAPTAARRPHAITGPPTAVHIASGLVDSSDIADADITVIAPADYAGRKRHEGDHADGTHLAASRLVLHCGACLVSVSDHSMTPNGAPLGSASTARCPPWRSMRGSTSTRPPSATALLAAPAASWCAEVHHGNASWSHPRN